MARLQQDRMFRKTVTRNLPPGAKIVTKGGIKIARWMTAKGEQKECEVNSSGRIVESTGTWYASYLGSSGAVLTVSLETANDKMAARRFAELTKKSALIRSGDLNAAEAHKSQVQDTLLEELIKDFGCWMSGNGRTKAHIAQTVRAVRGLIQSVGWKRVRDITRKEMVVAIGKLRGKVSERHRQYSCNAVGHFGGYLVDEAEVMEENKFRRMYSNKTEDRRHVRRALSMEEIAILLETAESRSPLRADTYRILLLTGLRLGELRTLRVDDLHLDFVITPLIKLKGRNEKNRKGSTIPLELDAIEIFRRHIEGKKRGDLVMHVPTDLRRRFMGDLEAAGIVQCRFVEENGVRRRMDVVDLHSLRGTYCTLMAIAKVPLVVAQKRMRHSTPALTANVYSMFTESDLIRSDYQIGGMLSKPQKESDRKAE